MIKEVGIATAGMAIGVPVWGIAVAIGGSFVAGEVIGFRSGGADCGIGWRENITGRIIGHSFGGLGL